MKFNDRPFAYHQEIEFEVSTLTNLGIGLGRVVLPPDATGSVAAPSPAEPATPTAEGSGETDAANPAPRGDGRWVIMVPFALPGERVRVRVYRNHKNYSEADLLEVLTPSPHRIAPPCPVFGRCGGCQYQHLTYSEQLAWKRRQVAELLERMAGAEFPVEPVIGSPREFGYRSKITPHFERPQDPADFPIGFLRQGARFELVDVPHCAIATEAINAQLPTVRAQTREQAAAGAFPRGGTILLREAGGALTTDYAATITETVAQGAGGPPLPPPLSRPGLLPEQPLHPAGLRRVRDRPGGRRRRAVPGGRLLRQRPVRARRRPRL